MRSCRSPGLHCSSIQENTQPESSDAILSIRVLIICGLTSWMPLGLIHYGTATACPCSIFIPHIELVRVWVIASGHYAYQLYYTLQSCCNMNDSQKLNPDCPRQVDIT
eukprot:GFUD01094773.1.p1 GENE.GFUD01094773.1~~GFUD01094773.1.p1  ORF type:complete len:108 (-),score=1.74 GFUD01094773.1:56-379(-)